MTKRSGQSAQWVMPMRGVTCDFEGRFVERAANFERARDQIGAIELARNAHGDREFAWSRCQVFDPSGAARPTCPSAAHKGESG